MTRYLPPHSSGEASGNGASRLPHRRLAPIPHPGVILAEELDARAMTQKALAEAMGRSPNAVNAIVQGKRAITAETALQLEHALGIEAGFWLRYQAEYDLARTG